MAIAAKFEADFAQFVSEAEKANGSLSKIEDTSKNVGTAIGDLKSGAESLAGAFGIAFSVEAAIGFLTTITEAARNLQILSAQTQINVEDLQVLGAATREYGIDSQQLGKAIFQLGQRISGGDASVVSGLALMGLSLEDVKNKHGEELFLLVEEAAGKLTGTLRDTAMADLYGARLGSSLGALSTGIGEAMDKARAMNTIMSEESVKAAADYANAIDRAKTNLAAMATTMIGPVAQGFNVVSDATQKGAGFWAIAAAMAKDFAASNTLTGASTSNLADLLDKLNQTTDANAKATGGAADQHKAVVVALTDEEQHAQFLATLQANASVALTAQNIKDLEQLKAIGELNAKNAAGVGVNASQYVAYTASVAATADGLRILGEVESEASAAAVKGYTARVASLAAFAKASLAAYNTDGQIAALQALDAAEQVEAVNAEHAATSEVDRAKIRTDAEKAHQALTTEIAALRLKEMALVNAAVLEAFASQTAYNKSIGLDAAGAALLQTTALDTLNARLLVIADMHTTDAAKATLAAQANRDYTAQLLTEAAALTVVVGHQDDFNQSTAKVPGLASAAASAMQSLANASVGSLDAVGKAFATSGFTTSEAAYVAAGGFINKAIGGSTPLKQYDTGGPVLEDGPIYAHAGEFVVPKGGVGGGGTVVNVAITLAALTGVNDARVAEQLRQTVEKVVITTLKTRVHLGSS